MSTGGSSLPIAIGDRVVYPNLGLCKVTGIETKEVVKGQPLSFVTLQREEDGSKVHVPEQKIQAIGVRKVATPDDVSKIFGFLKSDSDKASLDWKARARTNVERMAEGGLLGLAEVVKGLQVLSELRPLPTKERGLYNDARHLLVNELAAALSLAGCDAEDALDAVLFPPGKERPRRTAEEFKALGGDDELGMGEDLLGLDGGEPFEEGQEATASGEDAEAPAEGEAAEADADGEGEDAKPKAKGKPAKAPKAGKAPKPEEKLKKTLVSDFEVTEAQAAPIDLSLPQPKKRGRPPKPRPALEGTPTVADARPMPARVEVSHFHARPLPKMAELAPKTVLPPVQIKTETASKPVAAPAHLKIEAKPAAKAAVAKAAPLKAAPAKAAKPAAAAKKKPAAKPAAKKKK